MMVEPSGFGPAGEMTDVMRHRGTILAQARRLLSHHVS